MAASVSASGSWLGEPALEIEVETAGAGAGGAKVVIRRDIRLTTPTSNSRKTNTKPMPNNMSSTPSSSSSLGVILTPLASSSWAAFIIDQERPCSVPGAKLPNLSLKQAFEANLKSVELALYVVVPVHPLPKDETSRREQPFRKPNARPYRLRAPAPEAA